MTGARVAAKFVAVMVCWAATSAAQARPVQNAAAKPAARGASKEASQKPPAKPAVQKSAGLPAQKRAVRAAAGLAKAPKQVGKAKREMGAQATGESKKKVVAFRRDPFKPLVGSKQAAGIPENLPPGKAGLLIATTQIEGTVRSPGGMIAVVSNPQQRVYFIREGDHLYDGKVERIALDSVVFRQTSKDAFGKPVNRLITKRLYPSAGEQQ